VVNEFVFQGPFLKLGQNIGLLVGAVFWGIGSDIWGRRYFYKCPLRILYLLELMYFYCHPQVVFQRNVLDYRRFCPLRWRFTKFDYVMLPRGDVEYWCWW
jgi:hypothetical protein